MKIEINGESTDVGDGLNVTGLLAEQAVKMPDMVTVELNGEILDRNAFETTSVNDGDKIEFLYFMGGGARRR